MNNNQMIKSLKRAGFNNVFIDEAPVQPKRNPLGLSRIAAHVRHACAIIGSEWRVKQPRQQDY